MPEDIPEYIFGVQLTTHKIVRADNKQLVVIKKEHSGSQAPLSTGRGHGQAGARIPGFPPPKSPQKHRFVGSRPWTRLSRKTPTVK